jgi:Protein of unknown function (DUF3616)
MRYLLLLLTAIIVASGLTLYFFGGKSSATIGGEPRPFKGGPFEASGVIAVPGAGGVLIIDDGRPDEVLWMPMDEAGNQAGDIKPVKLGVAVDDPEGITTDGTYYYVVGSQSRGKGGASAGLVRFKFNPATQTAEAVQAVGDLKAFLVENVTELHDMGSKKGKADGINIEGLAWDAAQQRLLLGLRSPLVDEQALVVPLKLRDPRGDLSASNLEAGERAAMRLSLGGQGIRSIEYDERAGRFQIIAGATEDQKKSDFKLWEWDGQAGGSSLREMATFDRKLKPEGITRAAIGNADFKLVVFDTSQYLKLQ